MKRIARLLICVIMAFGLVSCGIVGEERSSLAQPEQSIFKQNFSIGAIIETHKDLLIEGPLTLSGTEAGPREPFIQSHETMTIQVDPDNASFLFEAIISDLEETLMNSGATIVGSGGTDVHADPIAYFSHSYSEGSFYGVVDVWGIRGKENTFIIISQITESRN